jgi:hypothetical protein
MITIIDQPEGELLNAYNNSVFEIESDQNPARATVEVQGLVFEYTPFNNRFQFNLMEVVRILINENRFADQAQPSLPSIYLLRDNTLYFELTATVTVFSSGINETLTIEKKYLKSVLQDDRIRFDRSEKFRCLIPSTSSSRSTTYFEGYPFDVSIFCDDDKQIIITNLTTGQSLTKRFFKGVNRLFVSDGYNDGINGFEANMPLTEGNNVLNFDSGNEITNLTVKKEDVQCGKYLKWFNQDGGWSYWLFEPIYQEQLKHKTSATINDDTRNLNDTSSRTVVIGKEGKKSISLNTGWLNNEQRLSLEQLFTSPKVYLYTNRELQRFKLTDWVEVSINSGSAVTYNSKRDRSNFKFTVEMAPQYLQNYAG